MPARAAAMAMSMRSRAAAHSGHAPLPGRTIVEGGTAEPGRAGSSGTPTRPRGIRTPKRCEKGDAQPGKKKAIPDRAPDQGSGNGKTSTPRDAEVMPPIGVCIDGETAPLRRRIPAAALLRLQIGTEAADHPAHAVVFGVEVPGHHLREKAPVTTGILLGETSVPVAGGVRSGSAPGGRRCETARRSWRVAVAEQRPGSSTAPRPAPASARRSSDGSRWR